MMGGLFVAGVYTDPGLRWLEDEPEPDPEQPVELLTVAGPIVWWSAGVADTDQD